MRKILLNGDHSGIDLLKWLRISLNEKLHYLLNILKNPEVIFFYLRLQSQVESIFFQGLLCGHSVQQSHSKQSMPCRVASKCVLLNVND